MLGAEDYVMLIREKFANSNQTSALDVLGFQHGRRIDGQYQLDDEIFNPATVVNHHLTATTKNSTSQSITGTRRGHWRGEIQLHPLLGALQQLKKYKDFITIGQNLNLNRQQQHRNKQCVRRGTIRCLCLRSPDPVYDDAGQYGFAQSPWVQKEYINPLSRLWLINGDGKSDQMIGNFFLEAELLDGLSFKTDFGFDLNWWDYRSFTPTYEFHPAAQNLTNE